MPGFGTCRRRVPMTYHLGAVLGVLTPVLDRIATAGGLPCASCPPVAASDGDSLLSAHQHAISRDLVIVRPREPRSCVPNALPFRREGRAPPGHGGGRGRRPSAPHAGTPGNGGPAPTRPAPTPRGSPSSRFPDPPRLPPAPRRELAGPEPDSESDGRPMSAPRPPIVRG